MAMRNRGGGDESQVSFQIAPMVDVVFILMLFFMASAAMQVHESQLAMNLPAMAPGNKPPVLTLLIEISANGLVSAGAEGGVAPVDSPTSTELPELQQKVKALVGADPKTPVIITPDGEAEHQRVIDVLNACTKAGATNISFG